MNSTRCLRCWTISEGDICNECGGNNVPVPYYNEGGTALCKNCGSLYQYKVSICANCNNNMMKEVVDGTVN